MTKEEAIATYGEIPLLFSSYYKYTFTFCGKAEDGASIEVDVGGSSDAIYRYDVSPQTTETLKAQGWYAARIKKDDALILDLYEY